MSKTTLCLLALTALAPAQSLTWITNPTTGSQYALTGPSTWADAQALADSVGAHLCIIDDAAENTWVADQFLFLFPLYLGGTDATQEGLWTSPYGWPISYTNWAPNQPDNNLGSEHALLMWDANPLFNVPRGAWNDVDGASLQLAVLERPMPRFTSYGSGCVGSNGTPNLAAAPSTNPPAPGVQITMTFTNLPTAAGLAFGLLAPAPAQVSLAVLGMPSCQGFIAYQPEFVDTIAHTGAAADWVVDLPNLPILRGVTVYGQGLVFDAGAGNAFGGTTTNALAIRLGY